jgi:hypothetical protein
MGRPRIYNEPRVITAIRLPTSLRHELQVAATERDVSVNFLVTRAVRQFLTDLPPVGQERQGRRSSRRRVTEAAS